MADTDKIQEKADFKSTPEGQYERWKTEMDASAEMLEEWQKKGDGVVKAYRDERKDQAESGTSRINLFWSNITTLKSMLFGSLPKIDVARQFADADDDPARIASEIMRRLLTLDVEENGEEYTSVLRSVLEDRLLPGLGCARVRYEVETEDTEVEATEETPARTESSVKYESAEIDYYFWRDVRYSWTRNWKELRWVAFRNYLTKDEVKGRFGDKAAEGVTLKKMQVGADRSVKSDDSDVWEKAEIWEIWDKSEKKVVFWCDGYTKVLETKPDPLKLKGFFPCPPFMLANVTTTLMVPVPDYCMAQDQYNKINDLETRINILVDAVKVVGAYDQANGGLDRILSEGLENKLIPVPNWAMFSEKGGFKGAIDWLPLDQVVAAIEKLREQRDDNIALLYQVVGMADIMRGQGQSAGSRVTGTEQELAAKFGSVRVQSLQEEFARFSTDLLQLKCEVISRHFEPYNILRLSNIKFAPEEQDKVAEALKLIKNPDEFYVRVVIRPESVAMIDYAALQKERTEYIGAVSLFMQSAAPLVEQSPESAPILMELLKWGVAGFKGSNQIEGVLDRAVDQMKKAQGQGGQKKDPEQVKAEGAAQLAQMKMQGEMQKAQMQHQNDMQMQQMEFQNAMKEIMAKLQADMQIIQAKFKADMAIEQMQAAGDMISQKTGLQVDLVSQEKALEVKKSEAKIPSGSDNE